MADAPPQPHDADNLGRSSQPIRLLDDLRFIVIEGVIGVGKTTLARLMAHRFNGQLVLEEFDLNPFLERFYEDRKRWGFQTQLAFLASRFRQQKALFTRDLFHQVTIADYSFDKDRIFAHLASSTSKSLRCVGSDGPCHCGSRSCRGRGGTRGGAWGSRRIDCTMLPTLRATK